MSIPSVYPSYHSLWSRNMVPTRQLSRNIGTKRSAVIPTSHLSRIATVPLISSFSATSWVLIHPWTKPSVWVWPLCQGTGTTDQANFVKLGYGELIPMSLHSALIWQLPVIEHKINSHGRHSWEWQCPLNKPHDNDDDSTHSYSMYSTHARIQLRPIRTAEALEAVDWIHQQTWLHCGIA